MKKLKNRIKTLYWFWEFTKHLADQNQFVIETGEYPHGYPKGKKWAEIWTPEHWIMINK